MKITKGQIELEKAAIDRAEETLREIKRNLCKMEEQYFIQTCGKPIWEQERDKWERKVPVNLKKSFQIKPVWVDTGCVCVASRGIGPLRTVGFWGCPHCKQERGIKYIATGHDHTDYSYDVCDCEGASKTGKPNSELK